MSLVIHTVVKDGIVVSADTRTTCQTEQSRKELINYENYTNSGHNC